MKAKRFWQVVGAMLLALALLWAAATALAGPLAQGPDNEDDGSGVQSAAGPLTLMDDVIQVQGRLTDASGNPINGTRAITYALYTASSGGTALCSDPDTVAITDGLFNSQFDFCTASIINGQRLYLGITVAGDAEMTPRQQLYSVPYAWSLRPGAIISDNGSTTVKVYNTSGGADGLYAETSASGTANGALHGKGTGTAPGVLGENGSAGNGVLGKAGLFAAGVKGEGNVLAYGGWFTSSNIVLYLTSPSEDATNAILVDGGTNSEYDFRVTNSGAAYADGGWNGAADFAELVKVDNTARKYEPGDVVVVSPTQDRAVALSSKAYSTAVIGVYSTRPGFVGSEHPMSDALPGEIPVAIVGIVPVKVSAENGSIHRGDLLTTSNTPGHAMKVTDFARAQGAVFGKAMTALPGGQGHVLVLVSLQ